MLKQMIQSDTFAAWLRHATVPLCDKMILRVELQLARCVGSSSAGDPVDKEKNHATKLPRAHDAGGNKGASEDEFQHTMPMATRA